MSQHQHFDTSYFSKILVIDIETVPIQSRLTKMNDAYQKHWLRKHNQIVKYMEDTLDHEETFFQRAGIYAEFGKIICISMARLDVTGNEAIIKTKSYTHDDEKELLTAFFNDVNSFLLKWPDMRFAGHNIKEFDLPFICRRALVHKLMLPQVLNMQGLKPWQVQHIDSLELWKFGDYKHYITLDLLAHLLGVESSKTDIDGSQVAEQYWVHNNLDRIQAYCEKDVMTTTKVIAQLLMWPLTFMD